jgi:hypothetical protein
MPLPSRLKILGLAAALSAGPIAAAQAESLASEFEASPPINAGVKSRPVPTGRHRPHAGNVPRDARQDAVVRNEEEFDRTFGMCRRC